MPPSLLSRFSGSRHAATHTAVALQLGVVVATRSDFPASVAFACACAFVLALAFAFAGHDEDDDVDGGDGGGGG